MHALIDLNWGLTLDDLIGRPVAVAVLVVLAIIIRWALHRLVDRLVRRAETGMFPERRASKARQAQRAKTMGDLLKSVITGIVVAVVGTMVLGEVGINIAPIVASAGIIGLALGFGAQSLVKDYLSGIFMIFEDQYGVGDVVDLDVASGTIEAVSLRVTRLRDISGTVWYVPNGEIVRVGNMSQNWSRAVVDIRVGYDADLVRAKRVMQEVGHDLWQEDDYQHIVIEEPQVTGVESLDPDAITLRLLVKTAPMQQWAVARELRQRIKARFDYEGITIPYLQRITFPSPLDEAEAAEDA